MVLGRNYKQFNLVQMNNLVHKNASTGVQKIFGAITVDEIREGLSDKKMTAQIRQLVTNAYPGVRGDNSLQDALFEGESFGAETVEYQEIRVAFVDVPLGSNKKSVTERLKKFPKARIYRILSLTPILTKEQERAMETGLSTKTREQYEAGFVIDENEKPVLWNGHKFYRSTKFSQEVTEDVDLRPSQLEAAATEDVQLGANSNAKTVKA